MIETYGLEVLIGPPEPRWRAGRPLGSKQVLHQVPIAVAVSELNRIEKVVYANP